MNSNDLDSTRLGSSGLPARPPVVDGDSISVKYRRATEPSIADLTIQLTEGINALVGRNGAGKSTLMNTIVTLQRIHAGRLQVLGVDLPTNEHSRRELMKQVGYLPQEFGYVPGFTVREFVEYAAWLKSVPSQDVARAVEEAIEIADLTDRASVRLSKLSGGMLRRAGIATAIVHNPGLVVLDEPTAGLDPEQRIRFRETLRKIAVNRCVLISSHLIEDVSAIADRVLVLDAGRLIFTGSVAEMQAHSSADAEGDSVLERAYTALVSRSRTTGASEQ